MIRLIVIVVSLASLVAGYWWWAGRGPEAIQVNTLIVDTGSVTTNLSLSGELVNDRTVIITALLDGEITAISAREGDVVKAGQSLASQDPIAAKAQLDRAAAERLIAGAEADEATRSLVRADRLFRRGDLSKQLFDESELAATRANASVVVAESSVVIASRTVRDATIRAPFDGQVVAQSTETGQWVEAGTPLFTLVATTGQVIEAYVDATDIAKVAFDQVAMLRREADRKLPIGE